MKNDSPKFTSMAPMRVWRRRPLGRAASPTIPDNCLSSLDFTDTLVAMPEIQTASKNETLREFMDGVKRIRSLASRGPSDPYAGGQKSLVVEAAAREPREPSLDLLSFLISK